VEVLVEVEEVVVVVVTVDRNLNIVVFLLALSISDGWVFEALGYGSEVRITLLVCNIIPKYLILIIRTMIRQ
jgi:hypothetical protein